MTVAYCSSMRCDPEQKSAKGKVKNVEIGVKTCPDCGLMLVWHGTRYRPGLTLKGKWFHERKEKFDLRVRR